MIVLDELDEAILDYLRSRDEKWRWVLGSRVLSRDETIELFKKDKEFRRMLREHIFKLAVELFSRKAGSDESGIRKT